MVFLQIINSTTNTIDRINYKGVTQVFNIVVKHGVCKYVNIQRLNIIKKKFFIVDDVGSEPP